MLSCPGVHERFGEISITAVVASWHGPRDCFRVGRGAGRAIAMPRHQSRAPATPSTVSIGGKGPLPHPGGGIARRRCCGRGIAITPVGGRSRVLTVETNRLVEAVVAAQLKPDGGRSRLLSRRPRVSTDAGAHRHAVPRTDVTVLDRRLPFTSRSGRLVASSPRARALPQLVEAVSQRCSGLAVAARWWVGRW